MDRGNDRKENKNERQFYYDNYYEDDIPPKQSDASDGKFHVSIPEERLGFQNGADNRDRTPKGRPSGDIYSSGERRTVDNSFRIDDQDIGGEWNMDRSKRPYNQDRTPKGAPVGGYSPQNDMYSSTETPRGGIKAHTPAERPRSRSSSYSSAERPQGNRPASRPAPATASNAERRPRPDAQDISSNGKKKDVKSRKSKKGVGKKIFIAVLSLILVVVIAAFGAVYSVLGKISYDNAQLESNQYIKSSELATSNKVRNILFLGSDYRDGEVQGMRSDTMMLFSIDDANKQIKLSSFLRDSYVCIPSNESWRKLNASCSMGGPQLVKDTLEYNFKVKIDNYILVDFEAFVTLIDKIGGIDVSGVTEAEVKYMTEEVGAKNMKVGKNHFMGNKALWYCRIRYLDDDFHRTQRQRKVISAIVNQVMKTSPKKLYEALEAVLPMIKTDIPKNDLMSMGVNFVLKYSRYDIKQYQVPKDGTWSYDSVYGEGSVIRLDVDENASLLKKFIYSDTKAKSKK